MDVLANMPNAGDRYETRRDEELLPHGLVLNVDSQRFLSRPKGRMANDEALKKESAVAQAILKQKDLLARVQSGELKVKDGGAKILQKLQSLEETLERERRKREEEGDDSVSEEMQASSGGMGMHDESGRPLHGSARPLQSRETLEILKIRETVAKSVVKEEDIYPLKPKRGGGHYRVKNGKLEPVGKRIPEEAIRKAHIKAQKLAEEEMNKSAERFLKVLRIEEGSAEGEEEEGSRFSGIGGGVGGVEGTSSLGGGGRRGEGEGKEGVRAGEGLRLGGRREEPSRRTLKVISIEEGVEWERRNVMSIKAHEEQIAARQLANSNRDTLTFWSARDVASLGESSEEEEEEGDGEEEEEDDDTDEEEDGIDRR